MKKRLISAFVALIISIPFIYFGRLFYVFALLLALIGLKEVMDLIIKDDFTRVINYLVFLIVIGSNMFSDNYNNLISNYIGIILLLYSCLILLKNKTYDITKGFCMMGINLFLSLSFSSIIITRNIGLNYLLYILILAFSNDTFAHLIGSQIGKHKINKISPNKSWEGSVAGLIFGTLISTLFYLSFINVKCDIFLILGINLLLSIFGQLGDMFFSLIKRNYNVKDFSNLMPGHGGVLDRLDSVIFISLAFTYFISFM